MSDSPIDLGEHRRRLADLAAEAGLRRRGWYPGMPVDPEDRLRLYVTTASALLRGIAVYHKANQPIPASLLDCAVAFSEVPNPFRDSST